MLVRRTHRNIAPLLASALLVGMSSCTELPNDVGVRPHRIAEQTRRASHHPIVAYWKDDPAVKGKPRILINLTAQQAFFFRGDKLVGRTNISSGRREFATPPGKYRVIQKDADHISRQYGACVSRSGRIVRRDVDVKRNRCPPGAHFVGAAMPYFLRFTGGYGMHAGFVPPYRASHGCVRMPPEMAQHFFEAAENGTPVEVVEPEFKLQR
jgi:hypothetical protein